MADFKKQETIEDLKKRYEKLNADKITAAADLRNANTQLEKLKTEAREKYGTDSLDELQKKLQQMKDENEQKRSAYQQHLEKIESDLKDVQQKFDQSITEKR